VSTALVSISIPCYNAIQWLTQSLESALAQTWPLCEIILVGDGEYFARRMLVGAGITFFADYAALSYYRSGQASSLSKQRGERARLSQFCSLGLIISALRRAEDSARTRRACAGYWRRFVHDFFPSPSHLIRRAEAQVAQLGETTGRPTMGPISAALARLIGWRNVWRLKHLLNR
jgi:cellulose synthase/poly-beta-1,6-N-acetylglucosamine synthase-like glycosyltransferase